DHDGDVHIAQVIARPNARKHEELRRTKGAGGKDYLASRLGRLPAAVADVFDGRCPVVAAEDATDEAVRADAKIGPPHRRGKKGTCRSVANAPCDRAFVIAEPLLLEAVRILGEGITGLPARLNEGEIE